MESTALLNAGSVLNQVMSAMVFSRPIMHRLCTH